LPQDDAMSQSPLLSRLSERLGPLEERPFRLLWIGQGASAIGDSLVPVAVAFAVLGIAGSATAIGLVMASFTLPRVLLILVGGVWADRLPRQLVMVAADLVRGSVEVVLAVLLLSGRAQLWELAAGAALIGAASAFFVPASTGLIPQTVSAPRLQQANALMALSRSATSIVGPSVSGLLVVGFGPGWVFAIDAATFAVSAASLIALRLPRQPRTSERQSFLAELAGGWREVVSRGWLLASILTFGVSNVAIAPVFVLGPVIANEHLGGAASWGLIVTGLGVGGLVGGLIALRWRPRRPLATAFMLGVAFSFPMLALAPPAPLLVIVVAVLLSAMVVELSNAWWYTVLQEQVPAESLSRVSSYDWLASIVFQPIGFAIVGPIAAIVSAPVTLVGAAVLSLTSNLAASSIPAIRRLEWKQEAPRAPSPLEGQPPMAGRLEIDRPVSAPRDQLPQ
jgi:predicted MFS family arabinose efflux permease